MATVLAIKTIKICGKVVPMPDDDDLAERFELLDGDVLDVEIDIADPEDPESITVRMVQRRGG